MAAIPARIPFLETLDGEGVGNVFPIILYNRPVKIQIVSSGLPGKAMPWKRGKSGGRAKETTCNKQVRRVTICQAVQEVPLLRVKGALLIITHGQQMYTGHMATWFMVCSVVTKSRGKIIAGPPACGALGHACPLLCVSRCLQPEPPWPASSFSPTSSCDQVAIPGSPMLPW